MATATPIGSLVDADRMADDLRGVLAHPAGRTGIATLIGYGLILVAMTIVLFGGGGMAFRIFG